MKRIPGTDIAMYVAEIWVGRVVIVSQSWISLLQAQARSGAGIAAVQQELQPKQTGQMK